VTLWQAATEVLDGAIDFFEAPCWYTLDPASLLVVLVPHPLVRQDRHQRVEVADPSGTWRWQQNMAYGGDQELIVGLTTRAGDTWGAVTLYRRPGQPMFDRDEIALVRALSQPLAEGARRALLVGEALDPERTQSPAIVVLADDGELRVGEPNRQAAYL
jgi:hypothetical protein